MTVSKNKGDVDLTADIPSPLQTRKIYHLSRPGPFTFNYAWADGQVQSMSWVQTNAGTYGQKDWFWTVSKWLNGASIIRRCCPAP